MSTTISQNNKTKSWNLEKRQHKLNQWYKKRKNQKQKNINSRCNIKQRRIYITRLDTAFRKQRWLVRRVLKLSEIADAKKNKQFQQFSKKNKICI